MRQIDPSTAINRAIVIILCILVCAGIVLWAVIGQAFTFKIQNNLDQHVYYALYQDIRGQLFNMAGGELDGGAINAIRYDHNPGKYHIVWTDPAGDWDSRAVFEIPADTTNKDVATVSIEFVPLKITILKPECNECGEQPSRNN
jgi:hypothetical protein